MNNNNWIALRACVMVEQNNKCAMCGKVLKDSEFTLHHILPRADGGKDELDNLIGLCNECHDIAEDKQLNREEIINYSARYSLDYYNEYIKPIRKSYFMPEIDNQTEYEYPKEIILKDVEEHVIREKNKKNITKEEEFYKMVEATYEYTPRELLLFFGLQTKKKEKR